MIFKSNSPKAQDSALYPGFKREDKILKRGTVLKEGALPSSCDILWERDIAIKLRDGVTIYTDVFRPPDAKYLVPTIIASGGFGKLGGSNRDIMDNSPWRTGVPQKTVSSLEKFEGPDPAYWYLHGYAILHPDIRGTWVSEGDKYINSTMDGKDGYDIVEWVATQSWSNQRITMAGNSYLAQTQWWVGAEQPPHLTCLAPWEGWNDLYRDTVCRGGIPTPEFQQGLLDLRMLGNNRTEDIEAMVAKYPLRNHYWEDRRAKCSLIDVPLYIVASWTNALHTEGTFRGWLESGSKEKWLRVHNSNEWPDLYYPENTEDLRKFFDYYMRDASNGWEFTPRVRLSILNPGHKDILNRPEAEFPLSRQQSRKLFLDASDSKMKFDQQAAEEASVRFDAVNGQAEFTQTFTERIELTGYFKLKLWVQSIGNNDIDLFVKTTKLDRGGNVLETQCIDVGYLQDDPEQELKILKEMHAHADKHVAVFWAEGTTGQLRVSHRLLDKEKSEPHRPFHPHVELKLLSEMETVAVEIGLWPLGMIWEHGEKMKITISGRHLRPELTPRVPPPKTINQGEVVIRTGGEFDSHLLVPFIPCSEE